MRLAYKDITGGPWYEWKPPRPDQRDLFQKRATLSDQYAELKGLGNIILGTVRGTRITRRAIRRI